MNKYQVLVKQAVYGYARLLVLVLVPLRTLDSSSSSSVLRHQPSMVMHKQERRGGQRCCSNAGWVAHGAGRFSRRWQAYARTPRSAVYDPRVPSDHRDGSARPLPLLGREPRDAATFRRRNLPRPKTALAHEWNLTDSTGVPTLRLHMEKEA